MGVINGTGWTLQSNGGCARVGHDCVMSTTSSSSKYFPHQWCRIDVSGPIFMHTDFFQTEARYDELTVNGHIYSGNSGNNAPPSTIVNGPITWTSDGGVEARGWKVCFGGSAPPSSDPWSPSSDPWNSTNSTDGNSTDAPWPVINGTGWTLQSNG